MKMAQLTMRRWSCLLACLFVGQVGVRGATQGGPESTGEDISSARRENQEVATQGQGDNNRQDPKPKTLGLQWFFYQGELDLAGLFKKYKGLEAMAPQWEECFKSDFDKVLSVHSREAGYYPVNQGDRWLTEEVRPSWGVLEAFDVKEVKPLPSEQEKSAKASSGQTPSGQTPSEQPKSGKKKKTEKVAPRPKVSMLCCAPSKEHAEARFRFRLDAAIRELLAPPRQFVWDAEQEAGSDNGQRGEQPAAQHTFSSQDQGDASAPVYKDPMLQSQSVTMGGSTSATADSAEDLETALEPLSQPQQSHQQSAPFQESASTWRPEVREVELGVDASAVCQLAGYSFHISPSSLPLFGPVAQQSDKKGAQAKAKKGKKRDQSEQATSLGDEDEEKESKSDSASSPEQEVEDPVKELITQLHHDLVGRNGTFVCSGPEPVPAPELGREDFEKVTRVIPTTAYAVDIKERPIFPAPSSFFTKKGVSMVGWGLVAVLVSAVGYLVYRQKKSGAVSGEPTTQQGQDQVENFVLPLQVGVDEQGGPAEMEPSNTGLSPDEQPVV